MRPRPFETKAQEDADGEDVDDDVSPPLKQKSKMMMMLMMMMTPSRETKGDSHEC